MDEEGEPEIKIKRRRTLRYTWLSTWKKHIIILLTKTTAAQNEVALSHHRVRGLYFLAVVFAATITITWRYSFIPFSDFSVFNCNNIYSFCPPGFGLHQFYLTDSPNYIKLLMKLELFLTRDNVSWMRVLQASCAYCAHYVNDGDSVVHSCSIYFDIVRYNIYWYSLCWLSGRTLRYLKV